MQTETPNHKAKEALPFLVKLGLAKPCEHCPQMRELAQRLSRRPDGVGLQADSVYVDAILGTRHEVRCAGVLHVDCKHCNNTGIEPTENGWRLLGFVKQFMDKASGEDLDRVEEIPF